VESLRPTGTVPSTLDDKGRVVIPAQFRDIYTGSLIILRGAERCAWLMTIDTYNDYLENFYKKSKKKGFSPKQIKYFKYQHESTAHEVAVDPKTGRIQIPPVLRSYANLTKECLVVNIDGHLEIWNSDYHESFMNEVQSFTKDIHEIIDCFSSEDDA
jgi:MraZ protein